MEPSSLRLFGQIADGGELGGGAALGGDVVARHGRSTWVDCTKDDGSVAFILLARVSPGERVHDIKSMASAVHHDGDTTEGVTWNGQGAEAISAAAVH